MEHSSIKKTIGSNIQQIAPGKYRRPKGLRHRLVGTRFRNSKLENGELLREFHVQSDHQTKIAPRAERSLNGKIQNWNRL